MHVHEAVLLAAEAGDLDVRPDADAELARVAGVAPSRLLGPGALDVGEPERLGQRQVVVAGVVGPAGEGVPRELLRLHEVAAPDLLGRHAELVGGDVEDPLEERGRLRPAGAAEGADRRRGGDDRHPVVADPRHDVRALRHGAGRARGEAAAEAGVRAAVADHPRPQAGDPALPGEPELDVLHLAAAVHRQHRLAAGLGPRDRPAEVQRRADHGRVVGGDAGLAAERAPDVGGDHPDLLLVQAGEPGEQALAEVRVLGREPHRQPVAGLVAGRVGEHRVALDGGGGEPVVLDPGADDHLGVVERVALVDPPDRDVAGELLVDLRGSRVGGGLRVDHGLERVVVDVDQLGGVDRGRPRGGDDQGDRVADVAHHVAGQGEALHLLARGRERRDRPVAEVGGGEHPDDAGGRGRLVGADGEQRRVRHRAADEHGVQDVVRAGWRGCRRRCRGRAAGRGPRPGARRCRGWIREASWRSA